MNRVAVATFFVTLLFASVLLAVKQIKTSESLPLAPASSLSKDAAVGGKDGTIFGVATVIHGDTIEIHGQRIRLHAIDAPESWQFCVAAESRYRCGQRDALYLQDLIESSQVACKVQDTDRYGRAEAVCEVGGIDLGQRMVASGWALAHREYDLVYLPAEASARQAQVGTWAGEFVEPWNWRQAQRLEEENGG